MRGSEGVSEGATVSECEGVRGTEREREGKRGSKRV